MPAIAQLAPRFMEDSGSGGISATAIVLIIILGLIPAVAVLWVAIWLMFFYSQDRNCCCVKRKKKKTKDQEPTLPNVSPASSHETIHNEKNIAAPPKRPWASHQRNDSGSSTESGRIMKQHRHTASDARLSVQSRSSDNTVQIAHEPKPFV